MSSRYRAFISYRHCEPDRSWATWLHTALETYRVPSRLRRDSHVPSRLGRMFRDEEELAASADLSAEIEAALEASEFLIVVCSPRTPASEWVNKEVIRFRELGRGDRILALLIEGEPHDAFPRSLRDIRSTALTTSEAGTRLAAELEPLAADARPMPHEGMGHRKRIALLRIVATLLGCRFDDLRRRDQERRARRVTQLAGALAAVLLVVSGLAVAAVLSRNEAVRQRETAVEINRFLDGMLASADPYRRDSAVTVRQVLGRAASNVAKSFDDQPLVRAELSETIGRACATLGEYATARELLSSALELKETHLGRKHPELAGTLNALANFHYLSESNFTKAKEYYDRADRLRGTSNDLNARLERAEFYYNSGQVEFAFDKYETIYRESRTHAGDELARCLNDRAYLHVDVGDYETAEAFYRVAREVPVGDGAANVADATTENNFGMALLYQQLPLQAAPYIARAKKIRQEQTDERSKEVVNSLWAEAYMAYREGRLADAERTYRKALEYQDETKAPPAPLAWTLYSMSPVLEDLGKIEEAKEFRQQAESMYVDLAQSNPQVYYNIPWTCDYDHGRIRLAQGDAVAALPLLERALDAFRKVETERSAHVAMTLLALGDAHRAAADLATAIESYRSAVETYRSTLGDGSGPVATALLALANALCESGDAAEAFRIYESAAQVRQRLDPPVPWLVARVEINRAECELRQGQTDPARQRLNAALPLLVPPLTEDDPRVRRARTLLTNESEGTPPAAKPE